MAKGKYIRTEDIRRKISEANKKNPQRFWLGKHLSEETKKKISEAHKKITGAYKNFGKYAQKGNLPWNTGKKMSPVSEETRLKLSIAGIGNKSNTGRKLSEIHRKHLSIYQKKRVADGKNHLWKGGITPINLKVRGSLEYKLWREAVFKRDNYTCVWCGDNRGGNLQADHIKLFSLFPELRFVVGNGRTLCKPCHMKTDTWGYKARQVDNSTCTPTVV